MTDHLVYLVGLKKRSSLVGPGYDKANGGEIVRTTRP